MTPQAFQAALQAVRWSGRQVAALAGYSPSLASQWASGRASVPQHVAAWLEALAAFHSQHPPPGKP